MKINLNDTVTFTLTEAGAKLWNQQWNTLPARHRPEDKKAGDTVIAQLWSLMEVFGPHTSIGMFHCFIENNTLEIEA